ncbi:MAG: DUF2378 family protein [Proteobacteria bacterium]|nr:DUF2378 family protein [Pseudomonadota bacterium]
MAEIRGTVVIDLVKILRSQPERARQVLPAHHHELLEPGKRVSQVRWMPLNDCAELMRAAAQLVPTPTGEDVLEAMGGTAANIHLRGEVFSGVLKQGDPLATLERGAMIWSEHQRPGRMHVESQGPTSARLVLEGWDPEQDEFCRSMTGFLRGLLTLAEVRGAEVRMAHCHAHGDNQCSWEDKWAD